MDDPGACCDPSVVDLGADLAPVARRLASVGFAALWRGEALTAVELLPDGPDATGTVEALVRRGRAEVDPAGRLVGIHGLTLRTTRHSFEHDGTVRQTWCAFDSVGIPAALGIEATVRTRCPACGEAVSTKVSGREVDVSDLVLWLPEVSSTANLMADFCAAADIYCSAPHLTRHVGDGGRGRMTSLADAVEIGCATWLDVAGIAGPPSGSR